MTHFNIKRATEGNFFKVKTIGDKLPAVYFAYGHPSRTPYSTAPYTFTNTEWHDAPILWENGVRNAYKGADFPHGIIFGIKQSGESLAYGEACKDMIMDYVSDGFLRCQTMETLYENVQYFVFAYITDKTDAIEVPLFRIADGSQYRAYKTGDNHYFILDENYVSAKWIRDSELESYGYRV